MMSFLLRMPGINQQKLYWLLTILMVSLGNVGFIKSAVACTPYRQYLSAPANINLNPSLGIGSVVATTSMSWPTFNAGGDCQPPYGSPSEVFSLVGQGTPNGNLYPTNIAGLSYRGRITSDWPAVFYQYWPHSVTQMVGSLNGVAKGSVLIEFVKTGPIIGSGTFGPQMVMRASIRSIPWFELYLGSPLVIQPTAPACTLTQSVIPVTLLDANTNQLKSAGDTSQDKSLSIPLRCNFPTNVALRFSGNVANTTNGVFRNLNTGSANASTVGIQLLRNGSPVPTASGSYINLGPINGSTSVPLVARYYALANNPSAGDVRTIVTATMLYN